MRAAIVLGGGRSARMGTDKLALERHGVPLLERVCLAAGRFADRVIVAGPARPDLAVEYVPEDPPFGGPVAGIAAALTALAHAVGPGEETLILAGDLAEPEAVVDLLYGAEPGPDGVVLVDDEGWPQFLAGRYRIAALLDAVRSAGDVRDLSVRRFLRGLDVARVPAPPSTTADVDTVEDAVRLNVGDFSQKALK